MSRAHLESPPKQAGSKKHAARFSSQRALCSLYSVKTLFNLLKWDLNGIYSSGNLSSALGDNNEPTEDVWELNYSSYCAFGHAGAALVNSPLILHLNIFNQTPIFAFVKIWD